MQDLRNHIEEITALTDEEFDFIASHFGVKRYRKNQYLVQDGEYVLKDFWVAKGLLK